MIENLALSNQELFEEAVERALAEGVQNQEAFSQIVESLIDEKRGVGELHDDNNLEGMLEILTARFPEFEAKQNEQIG